MQKSTENFMTELRSGLEKALAFVVKVMGTISTIVVN